MENKYSVFNSVKNKTWKREINATSIEDAVRKFLNIISGQISINYNDKMDNALLFVSDNNGFYDKNIYYEIKEG